MTETTPGRALRWLHRIEDGVLLAAVLLMVALAAGQILLRGLFGIGVLWIDPMLRSLVLWIGMLGALAASRTGQHIAIDVVTRALPRSWRLPVRGVACAFTAAVCAGFAWHGVRYTALEVEMASDAFADIPQWGVVAILPVAFALIGLRFAIFAVAFFTGREPFGDNAS